MKRAKGVLVVGVILTLGIAFLFSPGVFAQGTYRWVDEKGVKHFTDDPGMVPQKEWVKIKKDRETIREDGKGQGNPGAREREKPLGSQNLSSSGGKSPGQTTERPGEMRTTPPRTDRAFHPAQNQPPAQQPQ